MFSLKRLLSFERFGKRRHLHATPPPTHKSFRRRWRPGGWQHALTALQSKKVVSEKTWHAVKNHALSSGRERKETITWSVVVLADPGSSVSSGSWQRQQPAKSLPDVDTTNLSCLVHIARIRNRTESGSPCILNPCPLGSFRFLSAPLI